MTVGTRGNMKHKNIIYKFIKQIFNETCGISLILPVQKKILGLTLIHSGHHLTGEFPQFITNLFLKPVSQTYKLCSI